MTNDIKYFQQCMRIDTANLNEEIARQPELHMKIARAHTLAKSRLAADMFAVEKLRAKVTRRVAIDLEATAQQVFDLAKAAAKDDKTTFRSSKPASVLPTQVAARVDLDADLRMRRQDAASLTEEVSLWNGLREASSQRAHMFRQLVDLQICGLTDTGTLTPSPVAQVQAGVSGTSGQQEYNETRAEMAEKREAMPKRTRSRQRAVLKAETQLTRSTETEA